MTATERFKWLYVNAIERICVLEEKLEEAERQRDLADALLAELESGGQDDRAQG